MNLNLSTVRVWAYSNSPDRLRILTWGQEDRKENWCILTNKPITNTGMSLS